MKIVITIEDVNGVTRISSDPPFEAIADEMSASREEDVVTMMAGDREYRPAPPSAAMLAVAAWMTLRAMESGTLLMRVHESALH